MESKTEVIKRLLNRMGIGKPEPQKKSLVMIGRRFEAVKPQPKPKPKPVAVAKPKKVKHPDLKLVAMSMSDKVKIEGLINTDPVKALSLSNSLNANIRKKNAKIKAYNNLTELERERKEQRADTIKEAFATITENLPRPSEVGLDPNWNVKILVGMISKAGFQSALEAGILFTADVNQNLSVKVGAVTYKIELEDQELIKAPITKLIKWAGMGKTMDEVKTWDIIRGLGAAAAQYQAVQARKKSSDKYLEMLVAACTESKIKVKRGALINDYLVALALEVATIAVNIGFSTDKNKSAFYIMSSDTPFGLTEISKKDMTGIMERIISGSSVAGKLTGANMPKALMEGIINHLKL